VEIAIQAAASHPPFDSKLGIINGSYRSYHVPWAVIGACYVLCPILLLVIRAVLARENRIRNAESIDDREEYFIERITEDGKHVEVKVDKVRSPDLMTTFRR
jgi:hypothetical protein